MRKCLTIALTMVGAFLLIANTAFAKSTYGQCGPAVHNGSQLVNAWGAMGVLNSPAASSISKSAGWKPMDGGMVSFIVQRGREFKLAKPANVQDFGCKYGSMYSVGVRHYGAGESVIGIVPAQYSPNQIAGHPRKGYHKILMWLRTVGRGNCSNGFQGHVLVVAYVPNKHTRVPRKPKPAPKPAPKPKPKPQPAPKGPAAACITTAGVPLYAPLPSGVSVVNGVCTTTTTVTTQTCKEGQTVSHDSNGNMICIQNTNTNTNTITVPVTVVVTPPAPAPCGCTPPPAPTPTPTPPPPAAPSVSITSMTTLNDVPAGKTSGPFNITVNASAAGSVTIDPGTGGISDCNSSTPQGSLTLSLAAGNNPLCVIYYAPSDSSATQGTITITAIVSTSGGTAKDQKVASFAISQPTRPS